MTTQIYATGRTKKACLENARMRCACASNRDGTVTTMLCPVHSEIDPCLRYSRVTGKRRRGTIRRGVCTNCGWTTKEQE